MTLPLYAAALYATGLVAFLLQANAFKSILPWIVKDSSNPATLLLLMGVSGLAGRAYASAIALTMRPQSQIRLHLAMCAIPVLVVPALSTDWAVSFDGEISFWQIILSLLPRVFWPLFMLSSNIILLQSWFTRTAEPSAKDPYFLFSWVNLVNSFSICAYPLLIETYLSLAEQFGVCSAGYLVIFGLTAGCATCIRLAPPRMAMGFPIATAERSSVLIELANSGASAIQSDQLVDHPRDMEPTWTDDLAKADIVRRRPSLLAQLHWVCCAALPCCLLFLASTWMNMEIAAIPLISMLASMLYSLSLALAFVTWPFEWAKWPHRVLLVLLPVVLSILVLLVLVPGQSVFGMIAIIGIGFFLVSLVCHGSLARHRPTPLFLAPYYLWILLGEIIGVALYEFAAWRLLVMLLWDP